MKQIVNQKYKPLFTNNVRYTILMGGRGAGRSTVASQYVNSKLVAPEYFRCAIMRYVLSDIRNSIYREILDRAEENGIKEAFSINDQPMVIKYGNNLINAVGFRKSSGDQKAKLKSLANYNCVVVEEADEIPEKDFMQLDDSLRTVKGDIHIILLLNPPSADHWIIKRWFDLAESEVVKGMYVPSLKPEFKDVQYIRTSYKDNIENMDENTVIRYESYRETKPTHYWNMIRGYVPETVRGKIYSGWNEIEVIPEAAKLVAYGLDFGFTNDPTAITAIYKWNGGFILDEIAYSIGMRNDIIAGVIQNLDTAPIVADSAEAKSIEELKMRGLLIIPAQKGPGSVNAGIDIVKQQKIWYTSRSQNIKKEYNNYAWLEDKEGNAQNTPKPGYDHALDGIRYAINYLKPSQEEPQSFVYKPERPLYDEIGL